ncbi:MAG: formylglycine-generating enzyme family protein [Acidobacteria bacterium]|nr:formylglycine-generating enzyme family protein [Acidobacteriota bacterium]
MPSGDDQSSLLSGEVSYGAVPKEKYPRKTTSVGSFSPNPWGLYDMHGNVWEWCQDRFRTSYDNAPVDGSAWEAGISESPRMIRGGSCHCTAGYCRSASRIGNKPDHSREDLGFRVVATLR